MQHAPSTTPAPIRCGRFGRHLLLLALAIPALAGCKLVDQRTFDANADRKPVPRLPPAPPARPPAPPLALVRFQQPPETWQPALGAIVQQALLLKPEALFRVETHVPARGTPEAQAAAMAQAGSTVGRLVAETIIGAGASSAQLEMSATSDPDLSQPEVRVFVR